MNKILYVAPDIDEIRVFIESGFGSSPEASIELEYGNDMSADD